MASHFSVIHTKFFNKISNDFDYLSNTSEFTTNVTGNAGEELKLIDRVSIKVDWNTELSQNITFSSLVDGINSTLTASIDWISEGFYPGATIKVKKGGLDEDITILNITGVGNTEIKMSEADGLLLISTLSITSGSTYDDIQIVLTSVPTSLTYKYGLNPIGSIGENYSSPLDDNEQAYKNNDVTIVSSDMLFMGGQIGSKLGEVEVAYIDNPSEGVYIFEVINVFKIPHYVTGEFTNLQTGTQTAGYVGPNTYRYDSKFLFGNGVYNNSSFVKYGLTGDLGYVNENFNGGANNFSIENLSIVNALGTEKLEATEVNTVTFDVVSVTPWTTGIAAVLTHSKLPKSVEYQNKTTAFDDIWIYQKIRNTESGVDSSSGIFSDFTFAIDGTDPNRINVFVEISFDADQKEIISYLSKYVLLFDIANSNLSNPSSMNRVNLVVHASNYSSSTDVSGLITKQQPKHYRPDQAFSTLFSSDLNGGDGDLWGYECSFALDTVRRAAVVSAKLRVVAENTTNEFDLYTQEFPIPISLVYSDGTYFYQILNASTLNSLNCPIDDEMRETSVSINVPALLPATTQNALFRTSFQVPWRDWVENLNVDLAFYDPTEPNNNRNEKTSNYSGVLGYGIYTVLTLGVNSNVNDSTTTYNLYSDASSILDFDSPLWVGVTSETKVFGPDGSEQDYISTTEENIIKVEITHSSGTLLRSEFEGYLWMEVDNGTLKPSYLRTDSDWSSDSSLIAPSDTLDTGNTTLVEVITELNKVTLICKTNPDNLVSTNNYWVRGRLNRT